MPRSDRDCIISKLLSRILRHDATRLGLMMNQAGYVWLRDVLELPPVLALELTTEDIKRVVWGDSKQRFSLVPEAVPILIRAQHGHSLAAARDAWLMMPLLRFDGTYFDDLPSVCVHGIYLRHLAGILRDGLLAGGSAGVARRRHVHFSPYPPGDRRANSMLRHDCEAAVWVNLIDALTAQVPFFRAENGMICCPGVDGVISAAFIQMVTEIPGGTVLWPSLGASMAVAAGAFVPRPSAAAPRAALVPAPAATPGAVFAAQPAAPFLHSRLSRHLCHPPCHPPRRRPGRELWQQQGL